MNNFTLNHSDKKPNIAIIGAGLGGLIAAHQLTTSGAKVTIFEKDHHAGGRAQTVSRDGFHLNLGPHALYAGGEANKFLKSIGVTADGAIPQPKRSLATFEKELYDLPTTPASILGTKLMSVSEKFEFGQFMLSLETHDWNSAMSLSLEKYLETKIKSEHVRAVIKSFARLTTYGNNPTKISAGAVFEQIKIGLQGVYYLNDGWASIVSAIQTKLARDVEFRFESKVESIESTDDGVFVTVNGIKQQFDNAILAVPPKVIQKLAPSAIPSELVPKIIPSRAACLDVCLKKLTEPENEFAIGIDEPLYYSVHSTAAKLAPSGGAMIHLAYYLGEEEATHKHETRLLQLLDQLQPGWQNELVFKRFLPNMNASFGIPLAETNGSYAIPSPEVPHMKGVFIVGDYIGKGAMLVDQSAKNAIAAARQIVDAYNLENSSELQLTATPSL
ncbi:NAD(P)/FAD-dependent oxidoreductase [Candidatus Obscuribacterales bacterium]|nr:NAD(P)/FAD-dependent oxidoreductase [Candidatus Obscuribacterales bacterium]MBX3135994.1 NAD(P)/FAD-dependent oxidoreductase [Candidatus Obscuribacterales bacterium]MBX3150975.1 NAD(P)/FAD-dependent oxidoreductase [Candidatus Obscuribacterales bacterium]